MQFNFCGPYTVVPMPLNNRGEGPETDPAKVISTVHQVWDGACQTIASCRNRSEALEIACRMSITDDLLCSVKSNLEFFELLQQPDVTSIQTQPNQ